MQRPHTVIAVVFAVVIAAAQGPQHATEIN